MAGSFVSSAFSNSNSLFWNWRHLYKSASAKVPERSRDTRALD